MAMGELTMILMPLGYQHPVESHNTLYQGFTQYPVDKVEL